MARKSRKQTFSETEAVSLDAVPFINTVPQIPTAAYGRLSVEEEADGQSRENQIALLQDFIEHQSDLKLAGTYFDNGYTGTNFKRPDFIRLMDDVRQKKIGCIVVKDLSRFGRNMLEASYYIEKVFPFLGVRLIAVTDHFDSSRKSDMESISVPLRNLVNELYAKDISRKIWSSLQKKKKDGFAAGNSAPYGYIRNPITKRNEIDPETAFYVQLIFMWAQLGVSMNEIANRLQLLGAPTPRERLHQLGIHRKTWEWIWRPTAVRNILENQTYVGDTVSNKTTQALFAGQSKRLVPADEWIITPNTHPAIIPRDDFEAVQEQIKRSQQHYREGREATASINKKLKDELPEMVFCADCGARMEFDRFPHGATEEKKVCYYICKGRDLDCACLGHQITANLLQMLVMDQVHQYLLYLCDRESIADQVQGTVNLQGSVAEANSRYLKINAKVQELADKRRKLYEDYVAGVLEFTEYQEIRATYTAEYDRCRGSLEQALQERKDAEARVKEFKDKMEKFRKYLDVRTFDAELVRALVERIEIGRDRHIHLVFKFSIPAPFTEEAIE